MTRPVGTIVVGAGVSGLAYAHARGAEADLVVLESTDRAGGLVRTRHVGDVRFELGPEALRFERDSEFTRTLASLGVEVAQPPENARKRFIVHRGKLVEAPLSPPKLLMSPLLSLRGKLRLALEPFRDPKLALDGSVADFVRHRIGAEALAAMLDPLVSGIHAGDAEQLSMRACFPRLVHLVEKHGSLFRALRATRGEPAPSVMKPRGGCGAVTEALAKALGNKLLLSTAVSAITFDGSRWLVRAGAESFEAPQLVLAVPAASAARLLSPTSAPLARALGSIVSESLASIIHVWPRASVGNALDGFGYLVPSRERLVHLGTLFSSSIDPASCPSDLVVLRTLAGGARHAEVVDWDDARTLELVTREVAPMLGLRGAPKLTAIQRWRATLPRFELEHPERVAAIRRALPPGLLLLGNYLDGIGVNHLVAAARAS